MRTNYRNYIIGTTPIGTTPQKNYTSKEKTTKSNGQKDVKTTDNENKKDSV